jgi:predicted nucleic acid-binding protein
MARRKSPRPNLDRVFADTVFWIGLTNRRDQHHIPAVEWDRWVDDHRVRVITSEAVLWEWLNALSDPGSRRHAAEGYRLCHDDGQIEVIAFEPELMQAALGLYESHTDKGWSLTDCLSFVIMRRRRLTAALTTDHHFEQAGFRALLLQDPPS